VETTAAAGDGERDGFETRRFRDTKELMMSAGMEKAWY
jgi:hypothetical protein